MAQMSSVLWDPGSSAHQCGLTLHELTNLTSISLSLSVYTELVGGLEHGFYFPFSWECHHPNSRPLHHIFQRGWRKTTNQIYIYYYILLYIIILYYIIVLWIIIYQPPTREMYFWSTWNRKQSEEPMLDLISTLPRWVIMLGHSKFF